MGERKASLWLERLHSCVKSALLSRLSLSLPFSNLLSPYLYRIPDTIDFSSLTRSPVSSFPVWTMSLSARGDCEMRKREGTGAGCAYVCRERILEAAPSRALFPPIPAALQLGKKKEHGYGAPLPCPFTFCPFSHPSVYPSPAENRRGEEGILTRREPGTCCCCIPSSALPPALLEPLDLLEPGEGERSTSSPPPPRIPVRGRRARAHSCHEAGC